jgi:hypothetical protein
MANRNHKAAVDHGTANTNTPTQNTLPSSRVSQAREKNDDLIGTLSDAYENQRARQVGEWEKLYGQNVYRAGA